MSSEIVSARIEFVSPLTPTILQYLIKPSKFVDYFAGQYLQILVADEFYSYSIANAPLGDLCYELHIRHSIDNSANNMVLMTMKKHSEIQIKVPLGDCYLTNMDSSKPIIFIAVGLGFAPIKAMLEQLFANNDTREIKLYWGARTINDLYMHANILSWQKARSNFTYNSYLSQQSEDSLIDKVIQENIGSLLEYQIIMCGPFALIYKMRDALLNRGVDKENIYSDAFSFEI